LCKHCGEETESPKIFCSSSCSASFNNVVEKVSLSCEECKESFSVLPHVAKRKRENKKIFCSKRCYYSHNKRSKELSERDILKAYPQVKKIYHKNKILSIDLECEQCKNIFTRNPKKIRDKNKSGKMFCSKSCRMKYFNIHHHINKGCSKNISFPEDFLFEKLSEQFPSLIILRNDRKALKSGYEIDIYIPALRFGIEVNGPVHYMPIFGEERLKSVKFKDCYKYQEMHSLGISFLVIDVSKSMSRRKMQEYLQSQLDENIIPLINSKLVLGVEIESTLQGF
jgi:hypothetical protein